jgi:membrane-associated phospholipid phosphatase
MANSILTDIGKNVIGRPRPNFLASCQPNVTFGPGQTCDELITQFQCLNSNLEASDLEDQLKSFPSAHASFAAFMAFYLVLYFHERFKVFSHAGQRSPLKPFLQLCILAIYWWSALTRVSDYVHHPVDVLAGLLLGTCVALWSWTHLIELLKDIDQTHKTLKFSIT